MQKLDVWHVVWILVLVVGTVLLGVTFVIALYQRENSTFANFASIWGLFVALIGFIVTMVTLLERLGGRLHHEPTKGTSP
jgi:hypothetical protein